MINIDNQSLRMLSRRFWGLVFTVLIAVAVLIQLGRQAFPVLKDYQDQIGGYLGRTIGMAVSVGGLEASWSGMRPKLVLSHVKVQSESGEMAFEIANATMELSIVNSVLDRRLSWRQMFLDGFETTVIQADDGRWSIQGMPAFERRQGDDRFRFDDPYDVFLFGRRIKISDAKFNLRYLSGANKVIEVPSISIDNDRDFHRIKASLDVDGGEKAADFLVEGYGDPRDADFVAKGFLELKQFPTTDVLDALALAPVRQEHDQKLDLKLWFRGDAGKGTQLSGMLKAFGKLDIGDKKFSVPSNIESKFYGEVTENHEWSVTLTQLVAGWQDKTSPPIDVALYGDFRKFGGVRVPELNAKTWTDLALTVGLNSAKAEEIVERINPRGVIRDIDFAVTDEQSGYFQLRAYIEGGYSDAYSGAPGFSNINGYLSANLRGGTFDVYVDDGLTIDLPKVYEDPLSFEQASGQIRWNIDFNERTSHISSGLLQVVNPDEQGQGYFNLVLPFSKKYGEQELTLVIGVDSAPAKNHKKYVPKTIPTDLYEWLDRSIKQGQIADARFIYHGSVEKESQVSPSIQLHGKVSDGIIKFDPEWPELVSLSGALALDNDDLDIEIEKATLLGNAVNDAEVTLLRGDELTLRITGLASGNMKSAMNLVNNSPIKQVLGSTFDTWEASGRVSARMDLQVPLESDSADFSHKIDMSFDSVDVNITDLALEIDKLSGTLSHYTDEGLFAEKLVAEVWDQPFSGNILSPENASGDRDILVAFNGDVAIDDLYRWTSRPELRFMEGVSTVSGSLHIPMGEDEGPMEVTVDSDLVGVTVNLPNTFYKSQSEPVEFVSRIQLHDYGEQYQFTYGEKLRLALLSMQDGKISALIELNNFSGRRDSMQPLANHGRFDVVGKLGVFDLKAWNAALDQYFIYEEEIGELEDDTQWVPVTLAVDVGKFLVGDFEIDQLNVIGEREYSYWNLDIHSQKMAGKVRVPEDERPIDLDLDYLNIESGDDQPTLPHDTVLAQDSGLIDAQEIVASSDQEKDETQLTEPVELTAISDDTAAYESIFAEIDLAEAVALNFSTRELRVDGSDFGSWAFKVRPIENGIAIRNITANAKSLAVGSAEEGAEFIWTKTVDEQHSRFNGKIGAKDLAKVFAEFDQEKLLVSESASIAVDAQWPGAPDQATLETLKGVIRVNIRNGSFTRGAGSDENGLLRLLALFNFDTILRRLRLDFSDLAAQGYSYDKIYGSFDFSDGKIFLTDPLIVESSSSYLQLVGTVDLIEETLDSEMVVTLPVASNIALATAVIVGLPAALGVYVMSKLFKKQVDRASSLNVGVSGKWEDPKVKVKDIFDLDAANRKGKEIRERAETQDPLGR